MENFKDCKLLHRQVAAYHRMREAIFESQHPEEAALDRRIMESLAQGIE